MNQRHASAEPIQSGRAILGIELGSTRIKASLIAPDTTPLGVGLARVGEPAQGRRLDV